MAVSTAYVLHGVVPPSGSFLSQITSATPQTGANVFRGTPAGFPYALFAAIMKLKPALPLETTQVKTILDSAGALSSMVDLSGGNTDLYFKKLQDLGRRVADATTEHIRIRMSQAYIVLDRLTAGNEALAVASCRIGTTFDGTNAPMVAAGSVALAGTPTSAEQFVAGPVFLNTVQLPGVQEMTIEFNRTLIEVGGDGEVYDTFAAVQELQPVVTIRCTEHTWQTYGIVGTALTAGSFYLRKVAPNGTRVPDGTAQHIKFAATAGQITVDESSGGNNDLSLTTYRCTLVGASVAVEPITVNTAIAITN